MDMKKLGLLLFSLAASVCVNATDLDELKIYINPGHGGHDTSDDRNVVVPPFEAGDPEGYWESNSNLSKGLQLRDLLESFGVEVMMSRTTNTSADDRDLYEIGREGNAFGADFFFSIHSNATGTATRANYPMMMYHGYTENPDKPEDKVMAGILVKHLLENRVTSWSSESERIVGDLDFYPEGHWRHETGLEVLAGLTVPGMLSEGSFHDYVPETYRLLNDDFCWLEAYHFSKAIMEYFQASEKYTTGVVAGTVIDSHLERTDAIYNDIFYGHDRALPLCGATVELKDADGNTVDTYTTDELFNGVYMFKAVQPGTYTLTVSHPDYDPYEHEVTVTANEVTYLNPEVNHVRDTAPEVVSYSPVWQEGDAAIACNAPVEIVFNWDMDTASVEDNFSITPAVEGDTTWEDSFRKMVFTPKRAYDTSTVYTVTLGKDAKHPGNIALGKDFSFSFMTDDYNEFVVLASNPEVDGKIHYDSPVIEFRFNQRPSTTTIRTDIIVKDEDGNDVSYSPRTAKFSSSGDDFGFFQIKMTKDFEIGKTYTMNVNGNVQDVNGFHLDAPYSYEFTAVDAAAEGATFTMTESFDGDGVLVNDNAGTVGAESSSAARNTSTKLEGTAAYGLAYAFTDYEGGKAAYSFAAPNAAGYTNANAIGLKVYGDLSCNTLYAVLSDGTAEVRVPMGRLSYLGWKDVSVSLAGLLEAGKTYNVAGIEIEQTGGQISREGTVYVDKMSVGAAGEAGISKVEAENVSIYPNPASDRLLANGNESILGMELISLNGQTVASADGNALDVSEISSGIYIAKVYTESGFGVERVIVKH